MAHGARELATIDARDAGAEAYVEHFNLPMSDDVFDYIRDIARREAGIVIADYKKAMVMRRVAKRLRALFLPNFDAYVARLEGRRDDGELQLLVNALTTNKTEFFREDHHFVHLGNTALPRAMARARAARTRRLRLWSAGCSTGQEPYTIAMTLSDALAGQGAWDAKILATDIDTDVLAHAKAGVYCKEELLSLPTPAASRYTEPVPGRPDQRRVVPSLQSLITFKPLNLHGDWPMRGPFDIIFCRNVVIYFDREHQQILFDRLASLLTPGGFLYCGHSESLIGLTSRFRPSGRSIYERIK